MRKCVSDQVNPLAGRSITGLTKVCHRVIFLGFTGDLRSSFYALFPLLAAFANRGLAGRGLGEVTGPVVQLEVLLAERWVDELDLDLAE